jgi:hypothetical protein
MAEGEGVGRMPLGFTLDSRFRGNDEKTKEKCVIPNLIRNPAGG